MTPDRGHDAEAAPHPTFNAMLVCDNAIREEGTGKVSVIGIFANILATAFPTVHPRVCVYCNLGDAQGTYKFRLDLVRGGDLQPIGRGEAEWKVGDRTRPTEMIFELGPLVFDQPGDYEFQLYASSRLVGRKSFRVVKIEPAAGESR